MKRKRILIAVVLIASFIGFYSIFLGAHREAPVTPAREYVANYVIDKNNKIRFEETSISKAYKSPVNSRPKGDIPVNASQKDDYASDAITEDDTTGDEADHNMAEYFRFLQTNIGEGASPGERAESIRQHLLSTLSRDKAEELFGLYEKFTRFEVDAAEKAREWSMPESAEETLDLIAKMQKYQQEYFGEKMADILFGAEMKVMEYDARRAGIINDSNTPGLQKEELLEQLSIDMWGEKAYQAMNENKDPYDILDEKLLVYGSDLAAMDPVTREEEIKKLRAMYLPPGY